MILLHSKRYGIVPTIMGAIEVSRPSTKGHHLTPWTVFTIKVLTTAAACSHWCKGVRVVIIRYDLLRAKWRKPSRMALRVCSLLWVSTATATVVPTRRWELAVAVGVTLRGSQTGGWKMLLLRWCLSVGVSRLRRSRNRLMTLRGISSSTPGAIVRISWT